MAGRSRPSVDRPGDGQPPLAALFRHRAGQDKRQLRCAGRDAEPPHAAGLAGDGICPPGVEAKAAPQTHRQQLDLPAVICCFAEPATAGSRKPPGESRHPKHPGQGYDHTTNSISGTERYQRLLFKRRH